jgi:aspartyl-tRNA(Asn)/glutamyl-tRNA(Gln) amidotransferase subunit A
MNVKKKAIKTNKLSIEEHVRKIQCGAISATETVNHYLSLIKSQQHLNAFLFLNESHSLEQADNIDLRVKQGKKLGKLAGTVVAIKDNISIAGQITSCASQYLQNYKSPYSATVIERLAEQDAIVIGKTNLDEFGMGSSTENSSYAVCKNPFDESRVPGGSSGGSAVAVAAGMAQAGLGSDTGGSIRQPAAFTGLVGLKPSYGRVSRYGLVAYASSLDQIGPICHTVSDTAYILQIIAGIDNKDATSAPVAVPDYKSALTKDIKNLRIGVAEEHFSQGLEIEIKNRIAAVLEQLKMSGATVENIALPHAEYGIAAYYIIATAEASSNLARYDGIRYGYRDKTQFDLGDSYNLSRGHGFGEEVKRRIMLGTYVLSSGYYDAYYKKAQQVRRLIKQDYDQVFKKVDCIISPTTPTTAFLIGEKMQDPLAMYLSDIYTVTANLSGNCAINIPLGVDTQGLPIGMQIISAPFREEDLFRLGNFIENQYQF